MAQGNNLHLTFHHGTQVMLFLTYIRSKVNKGIKFRACFAKLETGRFKANVLKVKFSRFKPNALKEKCFALITH